MNLKNLLRKLVLAVSARSTADYWQKRYEMGLTSGSGSYDELADFKAEILNDFVRRHHISSVIEYGCGDGNQLALAEYPSYTGIDVSMTAIDICKRRFGDDKSKSFLWADPRAATPPRDSQSAELGLSLDVIYHLLEDETYARYLRDLFSSSSRFVIIYSSDRSEQSFARHVRHRQFTADVERHFPDFQLIKKIANRYPDRSFADFYIYERRAAPASLPLERSIQ